MLTEAELADLIRGRFPEQGDLGAVGLWLSIVVAVSLRLYPTDPAARIAWVKLCGWSAARVRGPTPISEVLLLVKLGDR